ncbi:NAD(P)/FAD-dependent oxidoreductase [Sphaerospermopsis aphanizomenoides BCCUSP55]|uniref:flavin-containing monooxygenase n=1 Tax=Sphaerospermopsis aphanizomenoides TaxID=459663 RepID=UPI0019047408|nr:NAD(P)/FAD-dependent oxidoreductase [Sphaerospermopsis aphanizomenoides]MBK1989044.1 NAD(P)/FAD-dependent oxidoreductase [Sphaerospermopsis aphanizomenoides BCCUSP55]
MEVKQICVIGAGISGLVTAKTFLEEGHHVTVFEKKAGLGGVWEKSRTYPELTSQNTSDNYCFSDYPMPVFYPDWPSAAQIRNYLGSYAKDFGVFDKIQFNTEVINLVRKELEKQTWLVTINRKDDGLQITEESYEFDFIVVCNGTFSNPNIPDLPGKEEFISSGGLVLHSTEFNDISTIKDKRVVVVGVSKSACDIATVAAKNAQECTLLFRRAKWKVPRFFLGLVNLKYVLLTRFSEAWFPYRKMGKLETLLHSIGKPLVWMFWRNVEMVLRLQLGLDSCGMVPEYHIDDLECSVTVATPNFFKYIRAGKINPIKTSISRFIPGGVELATGEKILADVVVLGTGFNQEVPFLSEEYRQILINAEGNFQLYRYLIHPEIPQMGFVGYNNGFYTPLTSEVGAWWLVDYVNGHLSLPSTMEMYQDINTELDWMKNRFLAIASRGTCIASFSLRYVEQLIRDMDKNHQLVIWSKFSQIMSPVDISIYHKLRMELKSLRLENKE